MYNYVVFYLVCDIVRMYVLMTLIYTNGYNGYNNWHKVYVYQIMYC